MLHLVTFVVVKHFYMIALGMGKQVLFDGMKAEVSITLFLLSTFITIAHDCIHSFPLQCICPPNQLPFCNTVVIIRKIVFKMSIISVVCIDFSKSD